MYISHFFFFFQAEDGIRDGTVTGVQTCALPIYADQLADTTMDPRTRMLRRIRMEDAAQASEIFSLLMGDDVPPRKQFIVDNADDFDRSKIDT